MGVLFHSLANYNLEVYERWSPPENALLSNTMPVILLSMISDYLLFKTIEKRHVNAVVDFYRTLFMLYVI